MKVTIILKLLQEHVTHLKCIFHRFAPVFFFVLFFLLMRELRSVSQQPLTCVSPCLECVSRGAKHCWRNFQILYQCRLISKCEYCTQSKYCIQILPQMQMY